MRSNKVHLQHLWSHLAYDRISMVHSLLRSKLRLRIQSILKLTSSHRAYVLKPQPSTIASDSLQTSSTHQDDHRLIQAARTYVAHHASVSSTSTDPWSDPERAKKRKNLESIRSSIDQWEQLSNVRLTFIVWLLIWASCYLKPTDRTFLLFIFLASYGSSNDFQQRSWSWHALHRSGWARRPPCLIPILRPQFLCGYQVHSSPVPLPHSDHTSPISSGGDQARCRGCWGGSFCYLAHECLHPTCPATEMASETRHCRVHDQWTGNGWLAGGNTRDWRRGRVWADAVGGRCTPGPKGAGDAKHECGAYKYCGCDCRSTSGCLLQFHLVRAPRPDTATLFFVRGWRVDVWARLQESLISGLDWSIPWDRSCHWILKIKTLLRTLCLTKRMWKWKLWGHKGLVARLSFQSYSGRSFQWWLTFMFGFSSC